MARTRNSDPGRETTLHYAATPRQRHAKRLVYAYLLLIALGATGWGPGPGTLLAQDRPAIALGAADLATAGGPCVAYQTFSILPNQTGSLPDRLSRTRVLLRVAPATAAGEWSAA